VYREIEIMRDLPLSLVENIILVVEEELLEENIIHEVLLLSLVVHLAVEELYNNHV
jgi:hypothetical protein